MTNLQAVQIFLSSGDTQGLPVAETTAKPWVQNNNTGGVNEL